jgi:hypothetical protein
MYKYKSKCRWNMLLHVDGEIVEIRPGELFESKTLVSSRYLEIIKSQIVTKPVVKKKGPSKKINLFKEEINVDSSTKS